MFCVTFVTSATQNDIKYAKYQDENVDKIIFADNELKMNQYVSSGQEDCLLQLAAVTSSSLDTIKFQAQNVTIDLEKQDTDREHIYLNKINQSLEVTLSSVTSNELLYTTPTDLPKIGSKVYDNIDKSLKGIVTKTQQATSGSTTTTTVTLDRTHGYTSGTTVIFINKKEVNYNVTNTQELLDSTGSTGINYIVNSPHELTINKDIANNRNIIGTGKTIININSGSLASGVLRTLNVEI